MAVLKVRNQYCEILAAAVVFLGLSLTSGSEEFNFDGKFYLMDQMEEINPGLKWEESGPLDGIADRFATCNGLKQIGLHELDDRTPGGLSTYALVDAGKGWETDFHSVQVYVRHVVTRWVHNSTYIQQFEKSESVACRIQPGCDGFTVVSCAFSYRTASEIGNDLKDPVPGTGAGRPRAFSPDQYALMEKLTGKIWDRSHFLENLASYDAQCSMIEAANWKFEETKRFSERYGAKVATEYGAMENTGSTEKAFVNVINGFSGDYTEYGRIGCCLIPDCHSAKDNKLYVLVVCLYA